MRMTRVLPPLLWLALGSCSGSSEEKAPAVAPANFTHALAKPAASHAEETRGMVQAWSPTHSVAIAEMKFEVHDRPVPGSPLDIDFALLPMEPSAKARLDFTASEGLALGSDTSAEFADVVPEQVLRKAIRVTPRAEGVHYVNAVVTFSNLTDSPETRSFSVPIIVDPPLKAPPAP